MKRLYRGLPCLVAAAGIWLATTPVRGSQGGGPAALISGEVRLGGPDGEVVPSADVEASDPATGATAGRGETDRDGRFSLRVAPGRYLVSAARPGFLTSAYGSRRDGLPGAPLVVTAGQHVEAPIVIERAAAVSGFVRDDQGTAVADATVTVLRVAAPRLAGDRTVRFARTDGDGHYRADSLPPGRYLAAAATDTPFAAPGATTRAPRLAPRFFPGVATADLAAPLALTAGQDEPVDFSLPRVPFTTVAGSLVAPGHIRLSPDYAVVVTAADDTPPIVGVPHLVGDGTFEMSLQPGRYRIDARVVGWPAGQADATTARTYYASTVVTVEDVATFRLDVPLREAVRVSGTVRGLGSAAATVGIRLVPVDAHMPAIHPVDAAIGRDGRFAADGVAPVRYAVELAGAGPAWVLDSVRFRGQTRPDATIDVDARVDAADLDVNVASAGASLSGAVIGAGATAASYLLALISTRDAGHPAPSRVYLTRPDNAAGYAFTHCVAGAYRLLMLTDVDPDKLKDETFLNGLRQNPASIPVTLAPGAETALNVRLGG
jgi:Carboxypeptidase regulatory-like domain